MEEITGDICSVKSGIVVQGCNAQGVMNSGLAKQIRQQYPEVYKAYKDHHKENGLTVGDVIFCPPTPKRPFWVANAITQKYYGRVPNTVYTDIDALEKAFILVADHAKKYQLDVHFPLIGAGLGGGNWNEILPRIENALKDCPKKILWHYPTPVSHPTKKPKSA